MAGIYMLATSGLENLGVLEEAGEGIYRFKPTLEVYFYDKRYSGPSDEALVKAVQDMFDKADTKKEDHPSPLDYV